MNSHNNSEQNDNNTNTGSGPGGREDRAGDRSDIPSQESMNMNDGHEFDEAGPAESGDSDMRAETPELSDLLKQASRLLRRKVLAAAAAGELGSRGQAIREQVDAVIDEALSDEELESLTENLGKIVDALGGDAGDAGYEWNDRREFAGRRGFGPKFGPEFGPKFGPGRGHGFGPRRDRGQRHEWASRGGWDSPEEWGEGITDEGRFVHHRGHEECGPGTRGADHRGRDHRGRDHDVRDYQTRDHCGHGHRGHDHRAGSRRRGLGRMVGAAFDHGFAAGYKRGVRF
ncbi:hypothetical protein [Brevibacterium aurantiacum]|uniref:hypothetical protein n=1 Tax=Brevibacterium aurantiacum TaxID=273384 RepID=UPI0021B24A35|nr:hypothetical protein [Brevibacterium aurantiacum]